MLLQLFFHSTIDAFSFNSQIRLIINGLLIFLVLKVGESRKCLKIIVASLLGGIGFSMIFVIIHIRYFKVVPSLFSLKLLTQVDDVGGSVVTLIKYDQTALFLGLILCLGLYIIRKWKKLTFKINIILWSVLALLIMYPWTKLVQCKN